MITYGDILVGRNSLTKVASCVFVSFKEVIKLDLKFGDFTVRQTFKSYSY
jgi:hypothetical protein